MENVKISLIFYLTGMRLMVIPPVCSIFENATTGLDTYKTFATSLNQFKARIAFVFPGTKWCGAGNSADSPDDVGPFSKADQCCRAHDMCPENIRPGSSKYGLRNYGLFTRSHCDCEIKFHECLKKAKTPVANSIGFTYFTVLGPQCFREDYPVTGCARYQLLGRCIEYTYNMKGEKKYQWFDNPIYLHIMIDL